MPRNLDPLEAFGFNPKQLTFASKFVALGPTSGIGANPNLFAYSSAANGIDILKIGVGRAAQAFGMIDQWIPEYREFANATLSFVADGASAAQNFNSGNPMAGLQGVWGAMDGLIQLCGVYEDLPIIGWIVGIGKAGFAIGDIIWEEHKAEDPEYFPAVTYNPTEDQTQSAALLDATSSQDWTPMFLPATRSPWRLETKRIKYQSGRKGWAAGLSGPGLGTGCMPGVDTIATVWQSESPKELPKILFWEQARGAPIAPDGAYWEDVPIPLSLDKYRPSYQQSSVSLWAHVLRNGPDLFRVNTRELGGWWNDYFEAWRIVLMTDGMAKWQQHFVFRILTTATLGAPASLHAPGEYTTLGVWPRHTYKLMGYPDPGKRGEKQPVHVLTAGGYMRYQADQTRNRQLNAMDTLTVAYLDGSEPAFGNSRGFKDQGLIDRFELRRQQLLEHPALHMVELDMVPAGPWKAEAHKRLVGGTLSAAMVGPQSSATMQFSKAKAAPTGPPLTSGMVTAEMQSKVGLGAGLLMVGMGLGAAALASRKGKR